MNDVDKTPGPVLIAFSGKKQTGKDSSADHATMLLETRGLNVGRAAFADVLKKTVAVEILGLPEENIFGTDEQKNELSDILWESFGMEIRMRYVENPIPLVWDQVPGEGLKCVEGPTPREGPMSFREVLQVVGTDIFRSLDEDVWVKATLRKIRSRMADYDVVILTDCRFPNEKQLTETEGGVTIRLERPDFKGAGDPHPSETALDRENFKYRFEGGDIDQLRAYVTTVLVKEKLVR